MLQGSTVLIVVTMLGAGVFGGIVNFNLSKPDDVPSPNVWRSIVSGVAASLLVPLFLNMISSNLLELVNTDKTKLLVFLGFCLVASISSTAFIRTLSDRVLTEARQARRDAKEARAEVEDVRETLQPIVSKETETETGITATASDAPGLLTTEDRILGALASGPFALRSLSGIARDTGIDRAEVTRVLSELANSGLVGSRTRDNGPRWFITEEGRRRLIGVR